MSIFKCSKCGCVENTAVSNYWTREGDPPLCSECDPEIGKWHGRFKKHSANDGNYIENKDGFLEWVGEWTPITPSEDFFEDGD